MHPIYPWYTNLKLMKKKHSKVELMIKDGDPEIEYVEEKAGPDPGLPPKVSKVKQI